VEERNRSNIHVRLTCHPNGARIPVPYAMLTTKWLNLETAEELNLSVPPTLLAAADT